jgi:peptidoglycan/LPS O-acetylase OafA/YrhL
MGLHGNPCSEMTQPAGDAFARRVGYLESIRGLASLQVLVLHVLTAFAPGLVFSTLATGTIAGLVHQSPLFYIYDGYSAVYLFLVMSGTVLTAAFAPRLDQPGALLAGRVTRLLVPAAAACMFSFAIKMAVGSPNIAAGALTHSSWLSSLWRPPPGVGFLVRDAVVNGLFLGYAGMGTPTLFGFGRWLDPVTMAYVAPIWTLSVELQGSVLVLLLTLAQRRSRTSWLLALAAAATFLARTHFICFIAGHVLAVALRRGRLPDLPRAITVALIAAGIFLCVSAEVWQAPVLSRVCQAHLLVILPCTAHPQKVLGALVLYLGLVTSPAIRAALTRPLLVGLGRLSFSIYLVHWPIVFGLGALLLVTATPMIGLPAARLATIVVVLGASLVAAIVFTRIDAGAIILGRRVRDTLGSRPAPARMAR